MKMNPFIESAIRGNYNKPLSEIFGADSSDAEQIALWEELNGAKSAENFDSMLPNLPTHLFEVSKEDNGGVKLNYYLTPQNERLYCWIKPLVKMSENDVRGLLSSGFRGLFSLYSDIAELAFRLYEETPSQRYLRENLGAGFPINHLKKMVVTEYPRYSVVDKSIFLHYRSHFPVMPKFTNLPNFGTVVRINASDSYYLIEDDSLLSSLLDNYNVEVFCKDDNYIVEQNTATTMWSMVANTESNRQISDDDYREWSGWY